MNKKIFGGIAIVAIAVAVAFNVTLSNQKQDKASMLALANVEALANLEDVEALIDGEAAIGVNKIDKDVVGYSMDRVLKDVKVYGDAHIEGCLKKGLPVASCGCNYTLELKWISCCISHWHIFFGTCNFANQNKDC